MESITNLTLSIPNFDIRKPSATPGESSDKSVLIPLNDVVSEEPVAANSEEFDEDDPNAQLEMEFTMYANRSDTTQNPTLFSSIGESSENSISTGSELDLSGAASEAPTAKLLFSSRRTIGRTEMTSSLKQTDSILQPRHTNSMNRQLEAEDDVFVKNKASVPPIPSPTKQRLKTAEPVTADDLADSLKELRLHVGGEASLGETEANDTDGLNTPPGTPPRPRSRGLMSPSKLANIPRTPHRPSVDTFWSQEFVNDWNDQHSPRKLVLRPTVKKSPVKLSPRKELKKSFEAKKHELAESFLSELDQEITQGKIAELAEPTGGVKLVWSKTLNTTAGRANWKRETIRTKKADGTQISVQYKHHASIELAEKVIDEEGRLLNVMAHEFCHLAAFMVDGMTTNPHGKEFKAWARKCSSTFGDRGVEVTTKHSYDIDFKYMWECADCGSDYKRHSRSIDPLRHRCGSCKGQLRQTRPVPRQSKQPSEYQVFVKEQMKLLREENLGCSQKDVMKMAAERWTKKKESAAAASGDVSPAADESKAESVVDETSIEQECVEKKKDEAAVEVVENPEEETVHEAATVEDVAEEDNKLDAVASEMVDLTLKGGDEA